MSLLPDQVIANNFKDFYDKIKPYLNYQPTMGFTPVGTIISVMGTHAPAHYLICDGTVYNILDHLELAGYFKEQFGSSNYFGGDGTTTFAVPDLRGEFLRGTGTNSHTNQGNGEDVGEHQDATRHLYLWVGTNGLYSRKPSSGDICASNVDDDTYMQPYNGTRSGTSSWADSASNNVLTYTSRPTNTSVLYCIAEKNIFIETHVYNTANIYSEEEQIIGEWIDGKPIHRIITNESIPFLSSSSRTLTDFTLGGGKSVNRYFSSGYIYLVCSEPGQGLAYSTSPFPNTGKLRITYKCTRASSINSVGYYLGTSANDSSLKYVNWGVKTVNQENTDIIDLREYDALNIYLTFYINVNSGNATDYCILSVTYEETLYDTIITDNKQIRTIAGDTYYLSEYTYEDGVENNS